MNNCKFYNFLSAKVDMQNGFEKIKKGEILDKEDQEALNDILNMVITFIAETETFIE